MYTKALTLLYVAAIASAGLLSGDHVAYNAAPGFSTVAFSTNAPSATYTAPAFTTFDATPAVAAYSTPVYAKTVTPAVSYTSVSRETTPARYAATAPAFSTFTAPYTTKSFGTPAFSTFATTPTFAAYSAPTLTRDHTPAVSFSSAYNTPFTYAAAAPVVARTYTTPTFAAYSAPVVTKTFTTPAVAAYTATPAVKAAITYGATPAFTGAAFTGHAANYGW